MKNATRGSKRFRNDTKPPNARRRIASSRFSTPRSATTRFARGSGNGLTRFDSNGMRSISEEESGGETHGRRRSIARAEEIERAQRVGGVHRRIAFERSAL